MYIGPGTKLLEMAIKFVIFVFTMKTHNKIRKDDNMGTVNNIDGHEEQSSKNYFSGMFPMSPDTIAIGDFFSCITEPMLNRY